MGEGGGDAEAAVPTEASGCQCGVSNNGPGDESGDKGLLMKAVAKPLEGEEELMFRGKKRLESFLFFLSMLLGPAAPPSSSGFCSMCVFSSSSPVFQCAMEVYHGVADS